MYNYVVVQMIFDRRDHEIFKIHAYRLEFWMTSKLYMGDKEYK